MKRDYGKWWSARLGRDMEYLWFGHSGRPLMVFPTSGGRYFENEDFGLLGALADKIDRGDLQVMCVDSIDRESWHNESIHPGERARRHELFDSYLLSEVVPFIHDRAWRGDLIVYGASFGAYHAANFAARHPEAVRRAICFSGVYDIHRQLDGYWDDTCYFNCPTAFIPNLDWEGVRRLASVEWVIATGEHDSLISENRHFAHLLGSKGIPVHAEFWPGAFGHDWPWWRENLRRFV
ncbi:MAG TPA: alpha/beta hydrolase-fold protein [Thermoanaerobaculia bacterium]|nr:alpha/beta hydrolase-fold protein [Thermoanaerobaculia bacterium]